MGTYFPSIAEIIATRAAATKTQTNGASTRTMKTPPAREL
jgi:hypothetical protein